MAKMLFIEGFPLSFTDQQRDDVFAPFGQVLSARVVRGQEGESLRSGYVEMASEAEAVRAQQVLHRTLQKGNLSSSPYKRNRHDVANI